MSVLWKIYATILTVFILKCQTAFSLNQTKYCYSENYQKQQESYYNFETPHYQYLSEITDMPENCKPVKIWLAIRHGTRYPEKEFSLDVIKFLPFVSLHINMVCQCLVYFLFLLCFSYKIS